MKLYRINGAEIYSDEAANTLGQLALSALAKNINLSEAYLRGANLSGANLRGANLSEADLRGANLSGANLSEADLHGANLSEADLRGANLHGANLREADLCGADLENAYSSRCIVPEGDIIGWKKLIGGVICKLRIPASAHRVGGMVGRKCRCEFAEVLEGAGVAIHDRRTTYVPGEIIRPDRYDPNPLIECAPGIHFFVSREEAESY